MLLSGKGQRITAAPLRASPSTARCFSGSQAHSFEISAFPTPPAFGGASPRARCSSSRYHTRLEFRKHGPLYRNILTMKLNTEVSDWLHGVPSYVCQVEIPAFKTIPARPHL